MRRRLFSLLGIINEERKLINLIVCCAERWGEVWEYILLFPIYSNGLWLSEGETYIRKAPSKIKQEWSGSLWAEQFVLKEVKKKIFHQTDQQKQDIRRKKPARIFKTESFHREGWWREDLQRPGSAQLWEWQTRRRETCKNESLSLFFSKKLLPFSVCVYMCSPSSPLFLSPTCVYGIYPSFAIIYKFIHTYMHLVFHYQILASIRGYLGISLLKYVASGLQSYFPTDLDWVSLGFPESFHAWLICDRFTSVTGSLSFSLELA